MFLLLVSLWLSLVATVDAGTPGENQIRAGVCAGFFADCALIAPQVEYANKRFVVGANSSLFVSNVYGKFYINNHPRYKVSIGGHYGLGLMPDEGGGNSADLSGVVVSTDILLKRFSLRLSVGHLLFNGGYLVDLGEATFSASAMYNFRLP